MAMRFTILGSGSTGNSALLTTPSARVLVDAGFSARRTGQLLHAAGYTLDEVQAIFITHEHGDHTAGLASLVKKFPHLRLFANPSTARAIQAKFTPHARWQLFETGSKFLFEDLEIDTFPVPHDAQDPVGFTFSTGREGDLFPSHRLAWLTDLGHAPRHLHERIREVDILVVESNHCPLLLDAVHNRPWSTKQRISGRHGHLSNENVRELLESVASPRWKHIFLTHLSRDCNSLDAVTRCIEPLRQRLQCQFSIVPPGAGTPTLALT